MKAITIAHFTEIFTLINLFGGHHVSWWWMLLFIFHDQATGLWAMKVFSLNTPAKELTA